MLSPSCHDLKKQQLFCTQIKELLPLKPVKQPAERVDEIIKEIKESTTITEVPLSKHISDTANVS